MIGVLKRQMNSNNKNISHTAFLQYASPIADVHPHVHLIIKRAHAIRTVAISPCGATTRL